jgi:hypothetical protein
VSPAVPKLNVVGSIPIARFPKAAGCAATGGLIVFALPPPTTFAAPGQYRPISMINRARRRPMAARRGRLRL